MKLSEKILLEVNIDRLLDKQQLQSVKHRFGATKCLGTGNNGTAFLTSDGKVLKITADKREAVTAFKMMKEKSEHYIKIFSVYKIKNTLKQYDELATYYYIILKEYVEPMPKEWYKAFDDAGMMVATMRRYNYAARDVYEEWKSSFDSPAHIVCPLAVKLKKLMDELQYKFDIVDFDEDNIGVIGDRLVMFDGRSTHNTVPDNFDNSLNSVDAGKTPRKQKPKPKDPNQLSLDI